MSEDEIIERDVLNQLIYDYKVEASDVTVDVDDGHVTLLGTVPSYGARQAATRDSWSVRGVEQVTNLLTVGFPPAHPVPSDTEVARRVEETLAWNPDIYSVDVDVCAKGGVVRLEGTVDAYWKKWTAESLVSELRGVSGIENHLTVAATGSFLDRDIANDIEAALERDLYVDAHAITVQVDNGRVVLTGSVTSPFAHERAYQAAITAPGVTGVDNQIVVLAV